MSKVALFQFKFQYPEKTQKTFLEMWLCLEVLKDPDIVLLTFI